jgi:hypothetical protein
MNSKKDKILKIIDNQNVHHILEEIEGKHLNFSWQDCGTIFFEIGELIQKPDRNRPQGEFSFMIDSPWRIEKSKQIICSSEFDSQQRDKFLELFTEKKVNEIHLVNFCNDLKIQFDEILFNQFCVESDLQSWSLCVRNENEKYLKNSPDSFWLYFENNQFLIEI